MEKGRDTFLFLHLFFFFQRGLETCSDNCCFLSHNFENNIAKDTNKEIPEKKHWEEEKYTRFFSCSKAPICFYFLGGIRILLIGFITGNEA